MEKQSDKKRSNCMIPIILNPNIGNQIYCDCIALCSNYKGSYNYQKLIKVNTKICAFF